MKKILLVALVVGYFCTTAAAQEEDPRGRYTKTGKRTSLAIFGTLPAYNGNPNMLSGLGRKTAGELGLVGKSLWNEYPGYAEEVVLKGPAVIRYDTATMVVKYLDDCRWYDRQKKGWVYHPNRLLIIEGPAVPAPPQVTTTTLTVTKTASSATATVGQPIQYTITVKNTGTVAAKSVQIRDTIASVPSVTVDSIMSVSHSYSGGLAGITISEDLLPGRGVIVAYKATVNVAGLQLPNTVTAWATNAPPVYAQALVSTPPPEPPAPQILECPKDGRFETWPTIGQRIWGGKVELLLSVGVGAGVSALASSDGRRGRAAIEGGVYSAIANRAGNILFPDHNRARLKVAGGESPELKKGQSGSFTIGELNYVYDWSERRVVVQIRERGCLWSASPRQTFIFTPVPIIRRDQVIKMNVPGPVKTDPGGRKKKKAPN